MNAGGHIAVVSLTAEGGAAAAHGESERAGGLLLGAALPDLAAIGRFRLLGDTDDRPVADGIALHHRTDHLFHRHRWFRTRNRDLTDELAAAGVPRGAAMACSHVGIELLLDGRLADEQPFSAASATAFDAIVTRRDRLAGLVATTKRPAWLEHLDLLARRRLPSDYSDPAAVAHRLHRILGARPRLALPTAYIDTVAAALAARKPSIDATALDLVADLACRLHPNQAPTTAR